MPARSGFTIMEIVVTMVIGAVLACLMIPLLGTALVRSGLPVASVQDNWAVNQVVENLTAEYRNRLQNNTLDLTTFNADLSGFQANGVTLSSSWVEYRSGNDLIDGNGDGVFEPAPAGPGSGFLLVTAAEGDHSAQVLFTQ